jgi:hypothetical protein
MDSCHNRKRQPLAVLAPGSSSGGVDMRACFMKQAKQQARCFRACQLSLR